MEVVTYPIVSWSGKTFKARHNYSCKNCGGIIPKGTKYLRQVVRLGPSKRRDPLRNVHLHLNCSTPWYQPESIHRLQALGNLPGKPPSADLLPNGRYQQKPTVSQSSEKIGTLLWQLPEALGKKILYSPKQDTASSALIEIEQALGLVLLALVQASGHRKKAMRLNHLITDITLLLEPVTSKTLS